MKRHSKLLSIVFLCSWVLISGVISSVQDDLSDSYDEEDFENSIAGPNHSNFTNAILSQADPGNEDEEEFMVMGESEDDADMLVRTKRYLSVNLGTPGVLTSSSNIRNVEGLLASCQLTNLLLYQAIQRQQQESALLPIYGNNKNNIQVQQSQQQWNQEQRNEKKDPIQSAAVTSTSSSPTFSASAPQDLFKVPLNTKAFYLSTRTFVTTVRHLEIMTDANNRPVTRTKTYDLTTSTVATVYTTIHPSKTIGVVATTRNTKDVTDFDSSGEETYGSFPDTFTSYEDDRLENNIPTTQRSQKPNTGQREKAQKRKFYDYESFYSVRPKRGEQADYSNGPYRNSESSDWDDPEYVLEPSSDSDQSTMQVYEVKCPEIDPTTLTVTKTVTTTLTKVNYAPTTSSSSFRRSRGHVRATATPATTTTESPRDFDRQIMYRRRLWSRFSQSG